VSDQQHDDHSPRTLNVAEAPFDAANQSLADALRSAFRVLKTIMIVLIVLYMFSGFECVEEHQKAVVLRFGRLLTGEHQVREPGLSWAYPFPVDETLRVGVTAETLKFLDLHTPASETRFGGLHPGRDGALLTGDKGLVHVKWSLVYRIADLPAFVAMVSDANDETSRNLVETLLQNAAVVSAAQFTAAEITQTRTDAFAKQVKRILNEELTRLGTGIEVTTVEIPSATPPGQTLAAFEAVTKAENQKDAQIQRAKQERNEILNQTAGRAHRELIEKLHELELAKAAGDQEQLAALDLQIDEILEKAPGEAGAMIREARAEYTETIQRLRGDVEEYESLLTEYRTTPRLLIDRLWHDTRRRLLTNPGVTKYYLPPGKKELRLLIYPDPEDRRLDEIELYRQHAGGRVELVPEPIE
jgi:regulator of protease activity HflC (stomatin/prohibitin superfamily)